LANYLKLTTEPKNSNVHYKISYSASRWSSYTLFVRTSHLDSVSGTGVVNTRLAICYKNAGLMAPPSPYQLFKKDVTRWQRGGGKGFWLCLYLLWKQKHGRGIKIILLV